MKRRSQEAVDKAIHDAERRVRRELLRRVASSNEAELERIFTGMAGDIRRDLKAVGYTEAQVEDVLRKRFRETFDARLREIESAIGAGADAGVEGDRRAARALDAGDGPSPFVSPDRKTRE